MFEEVDSTIVEQYIVKCASPVDDRRSVLQASYLSSNRGHHSSGPSPIAHGLIIPQNTSQPTTGQVPIDNKHPVRCVWRREELVGIAKGC